MLLTEILVCPVCKVDLNLENRDQKEEVSCSVCDRVFPFRDGAFDFTPLPPPDSALLAKWPLWEKLQENGLFSYTAAPDLNLSVGPREDVQKFAGFCRLSGLVLDIGCGPQEFPAYGVNFDGQLVGIDPLPGSSSRQFHFVGGIGEYLPFRDGMFDQVLFATSLDHVLDPKRTLAEARRVLKPTGSVNIWFDSEEDGESGKDFGGGLLERSKRLFSMLRRGELSEVMRRVTYRFRRNKLPPSMSYLSELEVPAGAVDHFHFAHLELDELKAWLDEVGLDITEVTRPEGEGNCFIRAMIRE